MSESLPLSPNEPCGCGRVRGVVTFLRGTEAEEDEAVRSTWGDSRGGPLPRVGTAAGGSFFRTVLGGDLTAL